MSNKQTWSLASVWNQSIMRTEERPIEPRDRIYASELGRSDVDIFKKLKGHKPSNPPNDRSLRKFSSGDMFEWFVRLVLVRAGIYIDDQTPVKTVPNQDMLEVSGKLDFIAGGKPQYTEVQKEIDDLVKLLKLPDVFHRIAQNVVEYFEKNYPDGLDKKILEIKSVATYGFEKVEKTNKALPGHDLQLFHYVNNLKMEGSVVYICRDDLRMVEIPILANDQKLYKRYTEKVSRVTKFYRDDIEPSKEPLMVFDEDLCRFSKNFNVEYSAFLTDLYGFERPDLYDEAVGPMVERFNRVLGRLKEGKEMTANNEEALADMQKHGFDIEVIKQIINKKNKK